MHEPLPPNPAGMFGDAAYRKQLLARVESLLSVLEIAERRLRAHEGAPGSDPERQERTIRSLSGTIRICRRARRALMREDDWEESEAPRAALGPEAKAASSFAEYLRFRQLGPITHEELAAADLEAICRRLLED
jgi:hypothetical protein